GPRRAARSSSRPPEPSAGRSGGTGPAPRSHRSPRRRGYPHAARAVNRRDARVGARIRRATPMKTLSLGPGFGAPIEITKDVLVGRDAACDVVVPDGSVSRRHARLEWRGDNWAIVDQASANGTFLDSQRIAEAGLRHGQELRLGGVPFKVLIE